MAYSKDSFNDILNRVQKDLDISNEMYRKAKTEYEALGEWIDESSDYDVSIYPQGSFALGTVIKPISGKDDYDLDLVCELADQYGLSAQQLKISVVGSWLRDYKRKSTMENKRRCWHVEYEDIPNFHLDVIPSFRSGDCLIMITEHKDEDSPYSYIGSNPKGYIEWFFSHCEVRWRIQCEQYLKDNNVSAGTDIQKLDRNLVKTPLQKEIQILKRHRDIMFRDLPSERRKEKPISIIITTIAAQLYNNEDSIIDSLDSFISGAQAYIINNMRNDEYFIENPSFPGENFAEKWNEHPERAEAFFFWLKRLQEDFGLKTIQLLEQVNMGKRIKTMFGDETGRRVFTELGVEKTNGVLNGTIKINTLSGSISSVGSITVPPNHHFHG